MLQRAARCISLGQVLLQTLDLPLSQAGTQTLLAGLSLGLPQGLLQTSRLLALPPLALLEGDVPLLLRFPGGRLCLLLLGYTPLQS